MKRLPRALLLLASLLASACAAPRPAETVDLTDPAIKARIQQEFRTHPEIDVQYLDLNVDNGTVTISGIVDSTDTGERLRKLTRAVTGVQQVVLNVLVRE